MKLCMNSMSFKTSPSSYFEVHVISDTNMTALWSCEVGTTLAIPCRFRIFVW